MKKLSELIKPYLSIVFGALLFLVFLNDLRGEGGQLALGIVGVVLAVYYLAAGILGIILGDKLPKVVRMIFEIASVSAFPVLMFVEELISVINIHEYMGPTAWTISILLMLSALAVVAGYVLARFVKVKLMMRLGSLFALAFVLALLLDALFYVTGDPVAIGDLNVVMVVLYVLYSLILLNSFRALGQEEPKAEEPKEEQPAE